LVADSFNRPPPNLIGIVIIFSGALERYIDYEIPAAGTGFQWPNRDMGFYSNVFFRICEHRNFFQPLKAPRKELVET
jgi:hypothetical protein